MSGDLLAAVGAMALSLLLAAWVLRLWNATYSVPFMYGGTSLGGDAIQTLDVIKTTLDHGWFLTNPSLGAPFGQQWFDFSVFSGDALSLVMIKAIGLFASTAPTVMNAFFLLGFPLIALSAFVVLRRLRLSAPVAVVCAVLFALLPYHFIRLEGHLFLTAYYAVPLGAYLFIAVLTGEPLFTRRPVGGPRLLAYATRRSGVTLALCAVIGAADIYYAAFSVLLLIVAAIVAALSRRTPRAAAGAVAAIVAIAVMAALLQLPSAIYHVQHGGNAAVAQRAPSDSEALSLDLTTLLIPIRDHRIPALASLGRTFPAQGEFGEPLGLIAAIGFVWLTLAAVGTVLARDGRMLDSRERAAAVGAWTAFVLGTSGGVSALIAYYVTPQIRAWNRISVFVAFFALLFVGLLLDRLRARLRLAPLSLAVVLAAVLVIGTLDQTSPANVPRYQSVKRSFESDLVFNGSIARRLPRGAAVYEFPYVAFPESRSVNQTLDYDPMRGYITSSGLRWSYGATKGRQQDWSQDLRYDPLSVVVPAIAAGGFDGIYVDRFGYADKGRGLEAGLDDIVGLPALISPDKRFVFYDLRTFAARLRSLYPPARLQSLREAALDPPIYEPGRGFAAAIGSGSQRLDPARGRATIVLHNPSRFSRTAVFSVRVETAVAAKVSLRFPDGTFTAVQASPAGTPIARSVSLGPGNSRIELATSSTVSLAAGGVPRGHPIALVGARVVDVALCLPGRQDGPLSPPRGSATGTSCPSSVPAPMGGELPYPLAGG